jgi:hypothetical protein
MSQAIFLSASALSYPQNVSKSGINRVLGGFYCTKRWGILLYHQEVQKIVHVVCSLTSG